MAEAIGTNHGVLDAPTIDASCYQEHAPYLISQFSESFADHQSFAALTKHRTSFLFVRPPTAGCLSCRENRRHARTERDGKGRRGSLFRRRNEIKATAQDFHSFQDREEADLGRRDASAPAPDAVRGSAASSAVAKDRRSTTERPNS